MPRGPNVQDFEIIAQPDGTISLWGDRWIEAGPLYFVSADGRKHIGFTEDSTGRIVAVTGGSWRVLERLKAVSGKR
jgi:hypothetical protein